MSRRNHFDPRTSRNPHDHIKWCQEQGCATRQSGTSHCVVTSPINGKTGCIPTSHELRDGTKSSLLRMYVAMGLLLALVGLAIWLAPILLTKG